MRLYGDLGLSGAAALAFLFFGPLIVFVVRRRWRLAAERQAEVRRLALLAAQEAAQAEREALEAYAAAAVSSVYEDVEKESLARPECPVCFKPATARCSRCKAIRYCSGRCQIIHWRQGHKAECHPPPVNHNYNAESNLSGLKGLQLEQLTEKSLDNGEDLATAELATLLERPAASESTHSPNGNNNGYEHEENSSKDISGKESSFGSQPLLSISSHSTISHSIRSPENSSSDNKQLLQHDGGLGEYAAAVTPTVLQTEPGTTSSANSNPLPPHEFARSNSLANNTSWSSILKKASVSETEADQSLSGASSKVASSSLDHASSEHFTDENQIASLQRIGNEIQSSMSPSTEGSLHASSFPGAKFQSQQNGKISKHGASASGMARTSTEIKSLKSIPSRFSTSADLLSTNGGSQSGVSYKSLMTDNVPRGPMVSHYTPGSVANGLPSSEKRVKEFSSSKRHYSELMLFPYDHFIKLYNSNKIELRPCGLINCGNSCYANVVLQCLTFTRPLTAYFLEDFHFKICTKQEWCFTCELGNIVRNTKEGRSPLSPIGILSHLHNIGSNFGHGQEEDAHEFLRYAIDAMQSVCLKEAGAKPDGILAEETTLIQQIFGGYLKSKIRCNKCKGKSERCERMMDLTVGIDGDIATLHEALSRFTSIEVLDGENKYECGRCKSYERARKRLTILEAPNVLTIVLKRFQSGKFGKLNKAVQFPEHLDLGAYMSGDDKSPVYGLYAVIVHIDVMNASFSGHYVCYVKDTEGKWYKIDDSKVKPVELEKVLSQSAYMLLYSRFSPRAPSSVRKAMTHDFAQARRIRRPGGGSSFASIHRRVDDLSNFHTLDLSNGRPRFPLNDSSSDSSSLFDEGSSSISTESTKDSTSTEDCWEQDYANLNSPLQDSDGFIHSPVSSGHLSRPVLNGSSMTEFRLNPSYSGREVDQLEVEGSRSFLFPDKSEHCRQLTGQNKTRNVDTDCFSPNEVNSSVLLRGPSRERTARTFY